MMEYSKSLLEVWKWKDSVAAELNKLPSSRRLTKIIEDGDRFLKQSGIQLIRRTLSETSVNRTAEPQSQYGTNDVA